MMIKLKKNLKNKIIIWGSLIFILIISLIVFLIHKNANRVVIKKHDLYFYVLDVKFEYKGDIKIDKDDEITQLTVNSDENIYLDSTPIYFKDEIKTIFPKNMNITYPISGQQHKINFYSYIYNEVGELFLKDRSFKKIVKDAILYDGKDIYYLIDKSTITFNDEKIELSPMSYIMVDVINDVMYIYDYDKDKIFSFTNLESDVIISTDIYKVNATLDLFYYNDSSRLLIRNINQLSNLK